MRYLRWARENSHVGLTVFLAIALIPGLRLSKLPVSFDWGAYVSSFWIGLSLQSIFFATLLYIIGFPLSETVRPVLVRYWAQKARLIILAPLLVLLLSLYSPAVFPLVFVAVLTTFELADRTHANPGSISKALLSMVVPAFYFFLGCILVFGYNDIIVSLKPFVAYDWALNRMDSWILLGATVPGIAHRAATELPLPVLKFFDYAYFGLFPQIGAAIVVTGLYYGKKRAVRLVGTLLIGNYMALILFYLWPSQGPYYLCPTHFVEFPHNLQAYPIQKALLAQVRMLWQGKPMAQIGTDFYIGFPCMHLAQPLVVLWFLRHLKRILAFLVAFDFILVVSNLLMEWHYFVDLLGGIVVAFFSIVLVEGLGNEQPGFSRDLLPQSE